MLSPMRILVIGASYGALIAAKAALARHRVTLVGRPAELAAMAYGGAVVDMPFRQFSLRHELRFSAAYGNAPDHADWGLSLPGDADPGTHDLCFLVVQEPQAAAPELLGLLGRIVSAGLPVVSLMNLAPLSWLEGLAALRGVDFTGVHSSLPAWEILRGHSQTLASPDAQAVRTDPAFPQRLRVTLPTNWKCAPFAEARSQAVLERLCADIAAVRIRIGGQPVPVPVRLVATSSPCIPFAKLPMLIAGNLRSILPDGEIPISEAVGRDPVRSRRIYEEVMAILANRGVPEDIGVPFHRYAQAAEALTLPSSAARGLASGATAIERPDLLVQALAGGAEALSPDLRAITVTVEARLARNRNTAETGGKFDPSCG